MLLTVAIASTLRLEVSNIKGCSELEFILLYLARLSLFTK